VEYLFKKKEGDVCRRKLEFGSSDTASDICRIVSLLLSCPHFPRANQSGSRQLSNVFMVRFPGVHTIQAKRMHLGGAHPLHKLLVKANSAQWTESFRQF
jgi:hypothetical protein